MKLHVGLGFIFFVTLSSTLVVQELNSLPYAKPFIRSLSTPEEAQSLSSNESDTPPASYCSASDYEQSELKAHQKYFAGGKQETRNVLGMQLTDLSSKLDILELALEDVQAEFLQQYAKDCRNALCIFEKLTGSKEAALRVFNMKVRTSYTVNFAQESFQGPFDAVSIWNAKEIRDIETGLQMLPRQFQNLKTLGYFRRSPKIDDIAAAYALQAYGDLKHGYILMMEKGLNVESTIHTVIHEVGHHVDFSNPGLLAEFQKLNTKVKTQIAIRDRNSAQLMLRAPKVTEDGYTSQYAATNSSEDFAESFSDYVVRAQHAYEVIPTKYDFMKDQIFQNLSYRDYSLEKMKEFDSTAFSQWFMKCSESISHMAIREDNFTISYGRATILFSLAHSEPYVLNMYQSCLYNAPVSVKVELGQQKICGNMGLHYQFRANLQSWINAFVVEMSSFMYSTIQESARAGLSKKEMLSALENKLMQMKSFGFIENSARSKVIRKLIEVSEMSTIVYDYKPARKAVNAAVKATAKQAKK